ncbi:hypothetical protein AAEP93_001276 [Penicillium crustosum]
MDQHDLLLIGDASRCFSRIGVLAYRSYQADSVLEWSGWLNQGQHESSQEPHPDLIAFAKRLRENVRRNRGEAVKTALAKACQVMPREMPDHISSICANHVAKIPFLLASEKYNRQFWKVLLHTIVLGTKLLARSAALLAALSLRMGIVPLIEVAEQEMLAFKDRRNDPAIP